MVTLQHIAKLSDAIAAAVLLGQLGHADLGYIAMHGLYEEMLIGLPSHGTSSLSKSRTGGPACSIAAPCDEQLQEKEERFRLLATSIPQLVVTTQHDGSRTWGSPQWIEFTGLSLEDSLGFGWLNAIHPDDRNETVSALEDAHAKGEYYAEQRIWRRIDQGYRWHQTRAKPLNGNSAMSNDWVGTMTDVHELRGLKDRQDVLMAELQHRTRNLLAVVQSVARQTARKSASLEVFRTEFESRLRALSRVQGIISRVDHQDIDLRTLICVELEAHGGVEGTKIIIDGPAAELTPSSAQVFALAVHELATCGTVALCFMDAARGWLPYLADAWGAIL